CAMARQVGAEMLAELQARYAFHLSMQGLVTGVQNSHNQIQQTLASIAGRRNLEQADFQAVVQQLSASRDFLCEQLDKADEWVLPRLKNLEDVAHLGQFLSTRPIPSELSPQETSLNGVWIQNLINAMIEVLDKGRRIQSKSMGGILALQETIADRWRQLR